MEKVKSLLDIVAVPKKYNGMTKTARGIFMGLMRGAFKTGTGIGGVALHAAKNPYISVPTAVIGGGIIASKSYQKSKNSSRPNYNTFLRNQALAGNINATEMAPEDLRSVRQLDMG